MSLRHYRDEELNYFKFSSLVLNEFPKALRQTFRTMWDNVIGGRPGFQLWDDSSTVRNMFVSLEGGKTKVPTHKSYVEWDCTALFQATIYAQTFCSPHTHSTLSYLYVKPRHVSHGSFHSTVVSPGGNNAETSALAIDQLRLLRNSICHASSSELEKKTFDQYIQYAKDAFKALGLKTDVIDAVGGLTESDFPTAKVRDLEQGMREEARSYIEFLEDISELKSLLAALKEDTANKDNITSLEQKIDDLIKSQEENVKTLNEIRRKVEGQTDILEGMSSDIHEFSQKILTLEDNTAIKEKIVVLQKTIDYMKTQDRDDTQLKI